MFFGRIKLVNIIKNSFFVIIYRVLINLNNDSSVLFIKKLVFLRVFLELVNIVIYLNREDWVFWGIISLIVFLEFILVKFLVILENVCVIII